MDLKSFDSVTLSEEGTWYTLLHPKTAEPTDLQFKLAGPDSATYRNSEKAVLKQRARRLREDQNGDDNFTEDELAALLTPCVLGWRNVELSGQPLEYSPANATRVLREYPIVRRQLFNFVSNAANFLQGVAANLQHGERGVSA